TVNIASSSGSGAASIVLQGTGVTAITVDKPNDTAIGAPASSEVFTFTNAAGANDTGQLTVALSGTNASLFQITADTCTQMGHLAGGGMCAVTITFVPGAAA